MAAWLGWPSLFGSMHSTDEEQSADDDLPVVIRIKGGMLEVASITGKRHFAGATDPVFIGMELPYCRERAGWYANYKITYRLKLGERWLIRYHGNEIIAKIPELEPSLPVAIDTASLSASGGEKCWFMLPMGTRERVLKRISADLKKTAVSQGSKLFAREAARKTVTEFLRTWAMNQTQHERISPAAKIHVIFPGE